MQLKEYYEKEAELTDIDERMYSTYFGKERFKKITKLMKQLDFSSLLDVGCGSGKYLIDKSAGVDISRGYLRQAKTRAMQKCLRVDLFQVDNTKLPFCSNSFDLVLCSEVLEHTVDWQGALRELIRVAKKYILVSVPGHTMFSIFQRDKSKSLNEYGKGHLHDITPRLIKKLLDNIKAKVVVEEVHIFTHIPPQLAHLHFLDRFLRPIFKKRGLNQVILLKKQS
jgi:ubiquinone/menaquinone biosynthesis C-methylase UbiE